MMDKNLVNKMKMKIKAKVEAVMPPHMIRSIRYWIGIFCRNDLNKLAALYGTDKSSLGYMDHYALHLSKFKRKRFNLLEIGVGGYGDLHFGGASLRVWKMYFPRANVFGIDVCDKSSLQERRIKIFQGDQKDESFLERVSGDMETIDVVVDDGSHFNEDVIRSFCFLFPKMSDGGIYVVEDTCASYWPSYDGDPNARNDVKTIMSFFKSLLDGMNYKEFESMLPGYEPSYFDKKIVSMHFYHNLIFIYKGDNDGKTILERFPYLTHSLTGPSEEGA